MHAYIIAGTDPKTIENKVNLLLLQWHISPFDTLIIEKEDEKKEISIQQIRTMTKQVSLSPTNGPFSVAIIKEAHLMTVSAQNALLKLLEEPPTKVKILLTSRTSDGLLQTILSRCEKIIIADTITTENKTTISLESLFAYEHESISQTLLHIDTLTQNALDARGFTDMALQILHSAIRSGNTGNYGLLKCSKLASIFLKTREHLAANINQKLALDYAFLEARQGQ